MTTKIYNPFSNYPINNKNEKKYNKINLILKLGKKTKYIEPNNDKNLYILCKEYPTRVPYKYLKQYLISIGYNSLENYTRGDLINIILLENLSKNELIKMYKILKNKTHVSRYLKKSDIIKIIVVDI